MKKAFTLVELLVVIGIIALLMAVSLPVMHRAREQGVETACQSNLRQMAMILKTYTADHDQLFPDPRYIYHSPESFDRSKWGAYPVCCRWHDARIGPDSILLQEHLELRGSLRPYLGNMDILICKTAKRANENRGCCNSCPLCSHDPGIRTTTQYTYTMNAHLGTELTTGGSGAASGNLRFDSRTIRSTATRRESQVTRSPSSVFLFGEQNSWAVNTIGRQPLYADSHWPAEFELSGKIGPSGGHFGTLYLSDLQILPTYMIGGSHLAKDDWRIGHAFATCHRPRSGDLNTGHSYTVMLDGPVERVTVADQLRRSRRVPRLGESRLGPGGNLALAWPIDIPPPGGWENQ